MTENKNNVFYIGGRYYSADEATTLCVYEGIFEKKTLYKSPQGAFFTISENIVDKLPTVEVITETAAHTFMDEHSAGIVIDNYNRVFGEPKQG